MSEEEEREWGFGGEDGDEYAYVDYAGGRKGKRTRDEKGDAAARPDVDATRARTAYVDDQEGAAQAEDQLHQQSGERAAPWIPDAFLGHHCPICLDAIRDSAMIESCHHLYCRSCLFEWLEVSDRCPLCKVKVSRVLFDIKSPKEYKVHVHARRNTNTNTNTRNEGSGGGSSHEAPPSSSSPSSSSSSQAVSVSSSAAAAGASSREYRDDGAGGTGGRGAEFRSTVYRRGLAAEPPEPKARRPKSAAQLRPWIAREVHAAAGGSRGAGLGDTRLVADVVEALLKDNDVDEQEGYCTVKKELQDFLFENTGPFLHELWCFRWSKVGMAAYDRDAVYGPRHQGG